MKKTVAIFLFLIFSILGKSQTHYLPLSEFKFNGLFGKYIDDTTTVYSLVCNDWQNKSFHADSLMNLWLSRHPDATFRPVCSFSYYRDAKRNTFTYGWIVSYSGNDHSLNIYLARHGICQAQSLLWAASPKSMHPRSDVYNEEGVETKIFIDEKTYREFVKKIKKSGAKGSPK